MTSPPSTNGKALEGKVIRTEAGYHRVLVNGRAIVSRLPKKLIGGQRTTTTPVVIGDRVRIHETNDGTGVIEEVLPRRNELVRGAAGGSRYLDVIASNLDLLMVVHSLKEPDFNSGRIDRFLLIAEAAEVPAALILNKTDLATADEIAEAQRIYQNTGYPILLTSAVKRTGIEAVQALLAGKESALIGPSGAGKSTLLNDIEPGLRLKTALVSSATHKGRHTTTTAELLPLSTGGWVADTPGLKELAIREVVPEELEWLFPDLRPYARMCKFSDCTHRQEIGCAIKARVESGEISEERYHSYRRIYEDLYAQRPF